MKLNRIIAMSCIVLGGSLLTACSSTPPVTSTDAAKPAASTPQIETRTSDVTSSAIDPRKNPKGNLAQRSIYFDYDEFGIKPDGRSVIESHAGLLNQNRKLKVRLEGNADERGSKEYNLALGQKRAESVAKTMAILGVSMDSVEAVSFGEEQPKATDHNEASWAQNRRVDIIYSDGK